MLSPEDFPPDGSGRFPCLYPGSACSVRVMPATAIQEQSPEPALCLPNRTEANVCELIGKAAALKPAAVHGSRARWHTPIIPAL